MLERVYTTKMSEDKKKLQNRFSKIRSENGRFSKLMALVIFAVILLLMTGVTILIAANVDRDEDAYAMTADSFSAYINRPVGAIMAELDYADEEKLVFHYLEGFFVSDRQTGEIRFMLSLPHFNVAQHQQGDCTLDVKISRNGEYAYLSSVGAVDASKEFDEYIINLETGAVEKGTLPEGTELFDGYADTHAAVQNPVGWYSERCVINGDWAYYLTTQTGEINGIELVSVYRPENRAAMRNVFGYRYVSDGREYTPSDIKNLQKVVLVAGEEQIPLTDSAKLSAIEEAFSGATLIKGGTACSFTAELIFIRSGGDSGSVTIATDSCAVFRSGDMYYDYGEGDNSTLLGYFGLDTETLLDLTFPKASA